MDNDVTKMICKDMHTLLSMMWLVGLWVFPGISQVQIVRWINNCFVIRFSLKIEMGIDNPVTGSTIK